MARVQISFEKTIDFLLKNRARMDARFEAKLSRLERVMATNNRWWPDSFGTVSHCEATSAASIRR